MRIARPDLFENEVGLVPHVKEVKHVPAKIESLSKDKETGTADLCGESYEDTLGQ
jgi:hypothetical protein